MERSVYFARAVPSMMAALPMVRAERRRRGRRAGRDDGAR